MRKRITITITILTCTVLLSLYTYTVRNSGISISTDIIRTQAIPKNAAGPPLLSGNGFTANPVTIKTDDFKNQIKKAEENRKKREEEERLAYLASLPKVCENQNVSQSWVDAANQTLRSVPKQILDGFTSRGWHMYCTDKNLDDTFFGGQFGAVMGCTIYEDRTIYLEDRTDAVTEGPVHELGHYADHTLGWASRTGEFQNIFQSEQQAFRNTFGVPGYFNEEELYAEAFWRYFVSPEMASVTPRLYGYIAKTVGRL